MLPLMSLSFSLFSFNFGIEVCDLWPRLNLRQANVPECECWQDLKKDRGPLVMRKHIACLEWVVDARYYRLSGQHDEPGHVARVILNSVDEYVYPIVSSTASCTTLRPSFVRVSSHWAKACGCEMTWVKYSFRTPGKAKR